MKKSREEKGRKGRRGEGRRRKGKGRGGKRWERKLISEGRGRKEKGEEEKSEAEWGWDFLLTLTQGGLWLRHCRRPLCTTRMGRYDTRYRTLEAGVKPLDRW
jgi:hypothetical protein